MRSSKERLFWWIQSLCWLVFILINGGLNGLAAGKWSVFLINSLVGIWGFGITLLFRKYIHRKGWKQYTIRQLIGPALLGILVVSFIWIGLSTLTAVWLGRLFQLPPPRLWGIFISSMFSGLLITTLWTALYFSYHFFRRYTQAEVEKWKLEAALKEAQLAGLRTQINPHFIFNALNNIRALILEDGEKARKMLTHLSDLLRYSLAETQYERVSLKTDLETVHYFMALHSIQFEGRLTFEENIEDGLEEVKIPPMLIQVMVENGIKHGISHQAKGGIIRLQISRRHNKLEIKVQNTGQLRHFPNGNSTGVGLKNIKSRLKLLYNDQASFSLSEKGDIVEANAIIPIS